MGRNQICVKPLLVCRFKLHHTAWNCGRRMYRCSGSRRNCKGLCRKKRGARAWNRCKALLLRSISIIGVFGRDRRMSDGICVERKSKEFIKD
ncbi:hypothetical protein Naga_100068g22 [Nannochloropsis gaditana]|uniref:Uncharacterized protein n=1 Tax=Nannochloropsis gaditana TaxID=72520 RepID=W7TFW7_9STRA|nr:hypothetical protein Naga_100068g22 [Nannochloropsis gaditana]